MTENTIRRSEKTLDGISCLFSNRTHHVKNLRSGIADPIIRILQPEPDKNLFRVVLFELREFL